MFIRKYWLPLSVFIVAIVGIGLYLLATQPPPEPVKIYKVVEPEKPTDQPTTQAPVVQETPQPQQDGHFHADGTWHEGPHETPSTVESDTTSFVSPPPRASGRTYHAELLASHPVEALRAQAEERGHWSAAHIPMFSPDDHEAATIARNLYLIIYYQSIGDTTYPEYQKAVQYTLTWGEKFNKDFEALAARREAMSPDNIAGLQQYLSERTRMRELHKLRWAHISEKYAVALIGQ